MVKADAIRQSPMSVLDNAKSSRKTYDLVWNAASRAPVFCKITKKTTPDGKVKKMHRTSRLIGSHAFQIAASGAAMNASRILSNECNKLRLDVLRVGICIWTIDTIRTNIYKRDVRRSGKSDSTGEIH